MWPSTIIAAAEFPMHVRVPVPKNARPLVTPASAQTLPHQVNQLSSFMSCAMRTVWNCTDNRLLLEQDSHQLDVLAHHIHLCFQASMSDESHMPPHPPDCKGCSRTSSFLHPLCCVAPFKFFFFLLYALKKKCNAQLAKVGLTHSLITLCPDKEVCFCTLKKHAMIVTGVWQGGDGQHAPAAQLPSCLYCQLPVCLHPYAAQRCHHVCRLPCSVSPTRSVLLAAPPPPCLWPPDHLACCCLLVLIAMLRQMTAFTQPCMGQVEVACCCLVFASLPACQRECLHACTCSTYLHKANVLAPFCSLQHCACESCMHWEHALLTFTHLMS